MFNERYIFFDIDTNDKVVGLVPSYTDRAIYVGAIVRLGVEASKTKPVYDWYVGYAGEFHPQAPGSWRANMSDTEVADLYFYVIRTFPLAFLNHAVPNLDLMGWHDRHQHGGRGHDFDPRKHGICLNGLVSQK